jgi:hypothetical protein
MIKSYSHIYVKELSVSMLISTVNSDSIMIDGDMIMRIIKWQ